MREELLADFFVLEVLIALQGLQPNEAASSDQICNERLIDELGSLVVVITGTWSTGTVILYDPQLQDSAKVSGDWLRRHCSQQLCANYHAIRRPALADRFLHFLSH